MKNSHSHTLNKHVPSSSSSSSPSGKWHPCRECGKKFWSEKALHGHMRCHPEREWRGINPPPNAIRRKPPPQMVMSQEEHEVAACLLLLANANVKEDITNTKIENEILNDHHHHHKCSICLKVFSSGQALGGHKRCHWEKGGEDLIHHLPPPPPPASASASALDLNLPPPSDSLDLSLRL